MIFMTHTITQKWHNIAEVSIFFFRKQKVTFKLLLGAEREAKVAKVKDEMGTLIWSHTYIFFSLHLNRYYKSLTETLMLTEGFIAFAYKWKNIFSTYNMTNIENGLQELLAMYSLSGFQRSNPIKTIIFGIEDWDQNLYP